MTIYFKVVYVKLYFTKQCTKHYRKKLFALRWNLCMFKCSRLHLQWKLLNLLKVLGKTFSVCIVIANTDVNRTLQWLNSSWPPVYLIDNERVDCGRSDYRQLAGRIVTQSLLIHVFAFTFVNYHFDLFGNTFICKSTLLPFSRSTM